MLPQSFLHSVSCVTAQRQSTPAKNDALKFDLEGVDLGGKSFDPSIMERLRAQRKAQVEADAVEAQKAMKGHATFNIGPSDELVARAERPGEPTDGSAAKHDEGEQEG